MAKFRTQAPLRAKDLIRILLDLNDPELLIGKRGSMGGTFEPLVEGDISFKAIAKHNDDPTFALGVDDKVYESTKKNFGKPFTILLID